ncbi:SDR family NAD(P)-dependent oxidoreductase [Glutamicibacter sp. M10]|uniref:SDR family NAD(P)-dependent oxidoreductase n=1 Tax=Glutamicibacter sp. M10 TaxID=3023076 RepID=UPI0021C64BD5|nr:SDR family NAD(P)-dependent oxidoreductase [Glutamicibacter sp. M10]UXN32289.1 SDR family NAD(P)-dependent oxidoreductase [Glutamicibacter sp. M10]
MTNLITTEFTPRATADHILDGVALNGKRMIVTGGASGIGAQTVRALAKAGAEVTAAVRNPAALQPIIQEAKDKNWPGTINAARLDLADLGSVREFTDSWDGPLHSLVANAGIMAIPELRRAPGGWEIQLATNYLGHFTLTTWLHDALRAAGDARVTIVSSGAHRNHPLNYQDPQFEQTPYDPWVAYGQSKTAGVLLAVGIANRWAKDGIVANALMPGWINTNLQRHIDLETLQKMGGADAEGNRIDQPHYQTMEQGAATNVLLAASPILAGVTGRYFEDNQEAAIATSVTGAGVAAHALDPEHAEKLWEYAQSVL